MTQCRSNCHSEANRFWIYQRNIFSESIADTLLHTVLCW